MFRAMETNPYQPPATLVSPEIDSLDDQGVPQEIFLQFRRAAVVMFATVGLFFALNSIDMYRQMSVVDAAISALMPIAFSFVVIKTMSLRSASDAKFSMEKVRRVSSSSRQTGLWLGPTLFAIGFTQVFWVPSQWHILASSCLLCGPLAFAGAFLWPRMEG